MHVHAYPINSDVIHFGPRTVYESQIINYNNELIQIFFFTF